MTLDDLIAHEEIGRLKHRYCDLCDRARMTEIAALFTEDGVCDLGPAFGAGPMVGRDAVDAGFGAFADMAQPWGTLHRISNPVLELDGERAAGTWYLHETLLADPAQAGATLAIGIYHDEYRRVDGTWLIASSRLEVLWSPAPAV